MSNSIFQSTEQQAASLDTESNVAARVLAVYPRYLRIRDEIVFSQRYGAEALQKAEEIAAILRTSLTAEELAKFRDDTPELRRDLTVLLQRNLSLCGRLAAVVHGAASFQQVLTEELDEIDRARKIRSNLAPAADRDADPIARAIATSLVGLAVSGGGIRSATFSLGILQALGARRLLSGVDYLSTVSGGGYIGAWLESLLQKRAEETGENPLPETQRLLTPGISTNPLDPEAGAVRFLRDYSNYLTPQKGMFSADTWTMFMIWLRNTFLNMIVIISTACFVLWLPRAVAVGIVGRADSVLIRPLDLPFQVTSNWLSFATLLLLVLPAVLIGKNLQRFAAGPSTDRAWYQEQHSILLTIILPTLLASFTSAICLWYFVLNTYNGNPSAAYPWTGRELYVPALFFLALMILVEFEGNFWSCFLQEGRGEGQVWKAAMAFVAYPCVSAFVFWGSLALIGRLMWSWPPLAGPYHAMTIGTPLILWAFALAVTIQIGLMGRQFPDDRREWFGRLGAWITIVCFGTAVLFSFSFYGPLWIAQSIVVGKHYARVGLPVAWITTTLSGVMAARKSGAGGGTGSKILTTVAPYVFVVGLLLSLAGTMHLLIAMGVMLSVNWPGFSWDAGFLAEHHWQIIDQVPLNWLFLTGLISGAVALLFSRTVDINEFSMHHFYKNRLVRCYLGACRGAERSPNPFTGFDGADERRLASFRHDATIEHRVPHGNAIQVPAPYVGPYPIINATLNLVKGDRLSWQERKGSSFTFTPKYCGWQYTTTAGGSQEASVPSFRTTNVYAYPVTGLDDGGIALGTAIAISGAAASPNMGQESSPALAFLMTVFNVRLGWWLGNPRGDRYKRSGPRAGLNYLLTELFGLTNDKRSYIYLSDGGHFENMGIYELVRRRCNLILVSDAEQDEKLSFGGLANAVRKCRTDFGVEIDIDVSRLRRSAETGYSTQHCALGTIYYPETTDRGRVAGTLIYVKSSLTGDEPTDVLEYRARQHLFPHQTTADQFFDESQFESYRRLGYHIAEEELHVSTLVMHYLESVVKISENKREKLQRYRSELRKAVESAIQNGFAMEEVMPRLPDLLARAAVPVMSMNGKVDTLPEDAGKQRSLGLMVDVIVRLADEEGLSLENPQHRALLSLFGHWSRLSGFRAYCQHLPEVSSRIEKLLGTSICS